tara:strand:+ start:2148 stop:2642 length:495 start_codon:yes stop_codon:yes gene_type:complete
MTRFIFALVGLYVLGAAAAQAAPPSGGNERNGNRIQAGFTLNDEGEAVTEEEDHSMDDSPRVIILPAIVSPLISDNRLMGYAYMQVRMQVREGVDAWDVRENAHYALDAMIRASHRESITTEDGLSIDREVASRVWMQALADHFGANVVESLAISSPDTRILRH